MSFRVHDHSRRYLVSAGHADWLDIVPVLVASTNSRFNLSDVADNPDAGRMVSYFACAGDVEVVVKLDPDSVRLCRQAWALDVWSSRGIAPAVFAVDECVLVSRRVRPTSLFTPVMFDDRFPEVVSLQQLLPLDTRSDTDPVDPSPPTALRCVELVDLAVARAAGSAHGLDSVVQAAACLLDSLLCIPAESAFVFVGHGDFTPSNVLVSDDHLWLIDPEPGSAPAGWHVAQCVLRTGLVSQDAPDAAVRWIMSRTRALAEALTVDPDAAVQYLAVIVPGLYVYHLSQCRTPSPALTAMMVWASDILSHFVE